MNYIKVLYRSMTALWVLVTGITVLASYEYSNHNFNIHSLIGILIGTLILSAILCQIILQRLKASNESKIDLGKSSEEITSYKYALDESAIVAVTDKMGFISYANDNFCKISKYSRKELIGQNHRIVNSGHHSEAIFRNLWVTITNGRIWKGELMNKAKDGTFYWMDTTIVPFLNNEGKPYKYLSIRFDISKRKKAEKLLEHTMSNITAILDNSGCNIYSLDTDLKFIIFNRSLQNSIKQLYGLDIKQEDSVHDLFLKMDPDEAKGWEEIYARAFKGETVKFERVIKIGDVESFIRFEIYPIRENHRVTGLSCFAYDITDEKIKEKRQMVI
ncbi:MAG: PAS domain-containing protein [bacterium]|nr:PAS domain-containing protein [bacterium]